MPRNAKPTAQLAFDEQTVEDPDIESALEERQSRKDSLNAVRKAYDAANELAAAKVAELELPEGGAARTCLRRAALRCRPCRCPSRPGVTKTLTKLAAYHVADDLRERLAHACLRLEVAGSLRRNREAVGDLELVAIPRVVEEAGDDVWGTPHRVSLLGRKVTELIEEGVLDLDPTDRKAGERYMKLVYVASGLQIDLFVVPAETFGLIWLIRTGPASYSQWLVTHARRAGYHVARGALHAGGSGHPDPNACACPVIPTPAERDVYRALGLEYEEPERRGIAA